jgi:hypothetical protein
MYCNAWLLLLLPTISYKSVKPTIANTAKKAVDLSQSTGTTILTSSTVVIDPRVTSTGTVVDETKAATSTVSNTTGTTSPITSNLLAPLSPNQDPKIDGIKVSGSINNDMTGSEVLDNLEVKIDSKILQRIIS